MKHGLDSDVSPGKTECLTFAEAPNSAWSAGNRNELKSLDRLSHALIRRMPRPKLNSKQLTRLKAIFRAAECTVRDLKGSNFEIFHAELPLRSHVLVNPYYLQLGTILTARPVNRRDKMASAIHAYLSKINKQANLAKFVLNREEFDASEGGWSIFASVRFVTGKIGGNYEPAALKNMVTIWFYDLANLMAAPEPFELCALLEESALPPSARK